MTDFLCHWIMNYSNLPPFQKEDEKNMPFTSTSFPRTVCLTHWLTYVTYSKCANTRLCPCHCHCLPLTNCHCLTSNIRCSWQIPSTLLLLLLLFVNKIMITPPAAGKKISSNNNKKYYKFLQLVDGDNL